MGYNKTVRNRSQGRPKSEWKSNILTMMDINTININNIILGGICQISVHTDCFMAKDLFVEISMPTRK